MEGDDIEVKKLTLEEGEFFCDVSLCFKHYITYIKFTTNKNRTLEAGTFDEKLKRTFKLNQVGPGPFMLQCLIGYFDDKGVTAFGIKSISKKNFVFLHFISVLILRHLFRVYKEFKKKYEDEN